MCNCEERLRAILREEGYELAGGVWTKGDDKIYDGSIKNSHFRIIAMRPSMWNRAAKSVARDAARQLGISDLV